MFQKAQGTLGSILVSSKSSLALTNVLNQAKWLQNCRWVLAYEKKCRSFLLLHLILTSHVLQQGLADYDPRPILSHHLLLSIMFHWHTATAIHLHITYSCLLAMVAELNNCKETTCPTKSKIFTIQSFKKKLVQLCSTTYYKMSTQGTYTG